MNLEPPKIRKLSQLKSVEFETIPEIEVVLFAADHQIDSYTQFETPAILSKASMLVPAAVRRQIRRANSTCIKIVRPDFWNARMLTTIAEDALGVAEYSTPVSGIRATIKLDRRLGLAALQFIDEYQDSVEEDQKADLILMRQIVGQAMSAGVLRQYVSPQS